MCGFAGVISSRNASELSPRVEMALNAIARRGPDGHATATFNVGSQNVVLGHRRLSIIDLSDRATQPMVSRNGRFVIVFNGEIYNYLELRALIDYDGSSSRSNGDTAILLELWAAYQERALDKLEGMFAFAVLDLLAQTLTLARDPFGVKPLYYARQSDDFIFGSETAAVNAVLTREPRVNADLAHDYLTWGYYDHTSETFFEGVHQLQPGTLIRIDLRTSETTIETWWSPGIAYEHRTDEQAREEVRGLLENAVELNLRSDVKVGFTLSGGLDSSILTMLSAAKLGADYPLETFSYVDPDFKGNEGEWVSLVNSKVRAHGTSVSFSTKSLVADLDDLIITQGEPFGSTGIYAQYRVYKAASERGFKVVLDGQGADEVFCGYNGHPLHAVRSLAERRKFSEILELYKNWGDWPDRTKIHFLKCVVGALLPSQIEDFLQPFFSPIRGGGYLDRLRQPRKVVFSKSSDEGEGRRLVEFLRLSQSRRGLPALLRHADRNSMRWSVESRVPFLSQTLVRKCLTLRESLLLSPEGWTKFILRSSLDKLIPTEILWRRDKVGFTTPDSNSDAELKKLAIVAANELPVTPFIDKPALLAHLRLGKFTPNELWRIFNFCRWALLNNCR